MNTTTNRFMRSGFTLVEVGIAVTLAAIVTTGATAMIFGLMRTNHEVRERLEQIAVRGHLADRFRADVAGAKSCTPLDEKQPAGGIVLHTDDQHTVRYVAGENDVQRIAETGDHVDARETYYLGDRHRAILTTSTDNPPVVRCTIEQVPDLYEPEKPLVGVKPRPALTIAAVLGRGLRLADTMRQVAARPKAEPAPATATESPTP